MRWMYEAFPKVIWMSEVVVPGDMDVWGRLGQRPGRGQEPDDRAGPPALPPGFPLQNYGTKKDCHPAVSLPNYHRHHLHGPVVVAYHAILRGASPLAGHFDV